MFSNVLSKNSGVPMVANHINDGTAINGNMIAQSDMRIDGNIYGNISCTSKVVIGKTSEIRGNIQCGDLTIEGKVTGNLDVEGILCFKSSAVFEGDVTYQKIIVEEGATIVGTLVNIKTAVQPQLNGSNINTGAVAQTVEG
jgi:cytoskeletal protein CcmA (bactofilin family)